MQQVTAYQRPGVRPRDIVRARARAAATEFRDAVARLVSTAPACDSQAPNLLFALAGRLDHVDAAVRQTIARQADRPPNGAAELLARVDACIDAAVDLAFAAFDPQSPDFGQTVAVAAARVDGLLDLVG